MSKHHVKAGSSQSTKAVAVAAKERRIVCVRTPSLHVDGMLVGMDDYHWVILDRRHTTHLVHKSLGTLSIFPSGVIPQRGVKTDPMGEHEAITNEYYQIMCRATEPFRAAMLKSVYHQEEEGQQ